MTATGSYGDGLRIDNVSGNETVHQRCLLVTGTCRGFSAADGQRRPRRRRREAAHDGLLQMFERALAMHGEPFVGASRPVVAGLVLDAHYAPDQGAVLAHAALPSHRPAGLSLALFGSHLTYAWPRCLEEVPACLLDARPPGDAVATPLWRRRRRTRCAGSWPTPSPCGPATTSGCPTMWP